MQLAALPPATERGRDVLAAPGSTLEYAAPWPPLESHLPALVVSRMAKQERPGKIFVDWSQNNLAKTTIAPWSLRGRERPTAATPWRWDEVERGEARHLLLDEAVVHHSTHADVLDPLG
jgi:bifunctional non-homologous end joining protein LigD